MSIEDRLVQSLRERSADVAAGAPDLHAVRGAAARLRTRRRARTLALSASSIALTMLVATGVWGWASQPWAAEGSASSATSPDVGMRGRQILDIAALAGTWYFVRVDGEPVTERVGIAIRDTDEGWWWGGPADECHVTGGPASITASDTLVMTATIPIPMSGCGLDDQRAAAAATIGAAKTVRLLSGDPERMIWLTGDSELALLERGADPVLRAEQLAGRWVVESIDGAAAVRGPADVEWPLAITVDYDEARTDPSGAATSPLWFSARFDCNTSSGPILAAEGSFAAEVEITTQVGCSPEGYRGAEVRERLLEADSWRYATGDPTRVELLQDDRVVLTLLRVKLPLTGSP